MPNAAAPEDERHKRLSDYLMALGSFVDAFSQVEIFFHFVLRWYTKTPAGIARAVFSGARIEVSRGFLRRLRDAGIITDEEWASLEPIIEQLRIITEKRNEILHYGARNVADGQGLVTNAVMALTAERITSFPISAKILRDMTDDLRKILIFLAAGHMGFSPPSALSSEIGEMLRLAWRYKSPQQLPNRSRPTRKTTKQKRQRSPSPE